MVYEPKEDSILLAGEVRKYAKGLCLDIGTGSGIQALEAAKQKEVKKVLACDIQKGVVNCCRTKIKNKKITFAVSNLFSNIKGRFDTIIFNPPYLPDDEISKDIALYGGKEGYELLDRFFSEAGAYLAKDGIILIVFSSLTKKDKVDESIKKRLFEFNELASMKIFFETLYVYLVRKSELLKELERRRIESVSYFSKGHRGILFAGTYRGKKAIIKAKLPESMAVGRIENEAKWLVRLNKKKIGPKIIESGEGYFFYEFVNGGFILDYLRASKKKYIKKTIKKIFSQLFELDELKADKEEMHHPVKHILVDKKGNPTLLDFERCHISLKPKNVTQFCQFLTSGRMERILKEKGIILDKEEMIRLSSEYKHDISKKMLNCILAKFD